MLIEASGATDVGRERSGNEDYMVVEPELGLFAVCDGMGGHAAGDVASRTAGEVLRDYIQQETKRIEGGEGQQVIREAVEGANRAVFELGAGTSGRHGMGTTCCAVLIHEGRGFLGHVGDSRLYLLRDGSLDQLTVDHNYANEAVRAGILTQEAAERSPYAQRVTRAVGVRDSVAPDVLTFDVLAGDTLLLCSDGLYQYAGPQLDLAVSLQAEVAGGVADELVKAANAAGGADNITAVVVRAHAQEEAHRTRKTQVANSLAMLRNVLVFRDLTLPERCTVLNGFRSVGARAGEEVLSEGEPSDSMFVVVEGTVEVFRGGASLASLGPGDHFGEMALLSQRPRSATVTAVTEVRLLEMTRSEFLSLVSRDTTIGAKFLWQVAQNLSTRLDDVYLLLPETPRKTQRMSGLSPFR